MIIQKMNMKMTMKMIITNNKNNNNSKINQIIVIQMMNMKMIMNRINNSNKIKIIRIIKIKVIIIKIIKINKMMNMMMNLNEFSSSFFYIFLHKINYNYKVKYIFNFLKDMFNQYPIIIFKFQASFFQEVFLHISIIFQLLFLLITTTIFMYQ